MGAINGFMVTRMKILPFIATLAGMLISSGTGLLLAHNQSVSVSYDTAFTWLGQGDFLGFPVPAWIAGLAYVYGSIALNAMVGGLNPSAVDLALKMGAKIVWFPTISAPQHQDHQAANPDLKFPKPSVPLRKPDRVDILDEHGDLRPEVPVILKMIADADAVVAGGHQAPDRIQILLEEARKAGVKRMIVNHPEYVIKATREQVVKFADTGALIEHECCMYDERSEFYHWDPRVMKEWIDLVGADRTSIGSDLGQTDNPTPIESFKKMLGMLHDAGVSEKDLRKMVRDNPSRLLGLS